MDSKRRYRIYGRTYTFTKIHCEYGIIRGYCQRLRKWADLFDRIIQFDTGEIVPVEPIYE